MVDAMTFLDVSDRPGRYGAVAASGPAPIEISERPLGALVQLTTWGQSAALRQLLGPVTLDQTAAPGRVSRSPNGVRLYQLAPDRLWLNADNQASVRAVVSKLDAGCFSELDLSSSRIVIEVSGPMVEDLMARLVTIDCAAEVFVPGCFAQTALHEVSVLVERTSADTFAISVPTTWAQSLWTYICSAAEPLGYEIATARA